MRISLKKLFRPKTKKITNTAKTIFCRIAIYANCHIVFDELQLPIEHRWNIFYHVSFKTCYTDKDYKNIFSGLDDINWESISNLAWSQNATDRMQLLRISHV